MENRIPESEVKKEILSHLKNDIIKKLYNDDNVTYGQILKIKLQLEELKNVTWSDVLKLYNTHKDASKVITELNRMIKLKNINI